jgi:putative phosphoribosyl transferase
MSRLLLPYCRFLELLPDDGENLPPGHSRTALNGHLMGNNPILDHPPRSSAEARHVRIPPIGLPGILCVPREAYALVVFVHGSGSSRFSPRNTAVADALNEQGIATLLFDLLNAEEEAHRPNVFNIPLLTERLVCVVRWLGREPMVGSLPLGLFGASTGAAAALVAAARLGDRVGAVVSRGGRPDLAGDALDRIHTPTLLIVGGIDCVIEHNEQAFSRLRGPKSLEIVPGASHLFPEPGALEAVIGHAARWFAARLGRDRACAKPGECHAFR